MRRAMMTNRPFGGGSAPGIASMGAVTDNATTADFELGYAFTVGTATVTVTKMRVYSHYTGTVTVNLWDNVGASLASANIAATANTWTEAAITPVVLSASTVYTVSLTKAAGTAGYKSIQSSAATFNPKIAYLEGRSNGTPGAYPSGLTTGSIFGLADVVIT